MGESAQTKLSRVRPPRVQITYDVEIGDAIEKKSLPFIVGILADLGGDKEPKLDSLKERKFVTIDRDNFDDMMKSLAPKFDLGVNSRGEKKPIKNMIKDGLVSCFPVSTPDKTPEFIDSEMILLNMDDLSPLSVTQHFHRTNCAFQTQSKLRDFLGKMDGNDKLINLLETIVLNENKEADELLKAFNGKKLDDLFSDEEKTKFKFDKSSYKGKETMPAMLIPSQYVAEDGRGPFVDDKEDGVPVKLETYLCDQAIQQEAWKKFDHGDNKIIEQLLDKDGGSMILEDHQKPYVYQLICQFAVEILNGISDEDKKLDPATLITKKIDLIREAIQNQLNEIFHSEKFQQIEAAWRGLHYLVSKTETSDSLKLKLLVISKEELEKDFEKAVEFDQTALFKKVYEDEYGTYGGEPYSMLVGDYAFGRSAPEMELLTKLSEVAAQAHTPFIAPASSKLFDMSDFSDLAKPRDLSKIFESAELIKWRSFRESEDSRYVTLTLPKVMLRYPYGEETLAAEGIEFEEDVSGPDNGKYLWGNSAYFLAERITGAFARYGWTAAIRGVEGGGLVEGLPAHIVTTKDGDKVVTCPTQIAITDRREKELNDLGFVTLCHRKGWDQAAFFGGQTTNKPTKYNTDFANMNASISAMLPYMLNASRFAHYIKVIMREKVGSFQTRSNIEEYLNTWITQYVLLDESAGQESKAAFPLQQGRVVVTEVAGRPGAYKAVVFLRPHFQLEELTASIRLVADIPA